jgi:hypothetical protein
MDAHSRERLAYREAGHAVAGYLTGHEFTHVTIELAGISRSTFMRSRKELLRAERVETDGQTRGTRYRPAETQP